MFRKQHGFTLIELMVTLVVLGILIAIGLPSFKSQLLNNKSVALGEDFVSALNLVRSLAVKSGGRASLCASNDGSTCSTEPKDWAKGFIVVEDFATTDSADVPVLKSNILRAWQQKDDQLVISVTQGTKQVAFIRYTPLGTLARVKDAAATAIEVKVKMQGCTSSNARKITIGLAGIIGVASDNCSASN